MKYQEKTTRRRGVAIALAAALMCATSGVASAATLFSDNFNSGANPAWGNERGAWRALHGTYDASEPSNAPLTYSSVTTLPNLTDFTVKVRVNDLNDGGVWLRSNYNGGAINGVLLVTGGELGTFNGLYWHIVSNGNTGAILNQVSIAGLQGSSVNLRIRVKGSTYSAYVGNSATPATTLTTSAFASGSVALYDFSPQNGASSPRGETFDNVVIIGSPPPPAR
jgi:pectate lyase